MTRARGTMVLALCFAALVACSGASRAQVEQAATHAKEALNAYCDARQKAIEALGVGDAGAGGQ